ncbi:MAG: DinB family protein, partial [Alphaproteobacteria bacterium]|nr:DinB family protein [Alphaproteobacteria bacterium]
MTASGPEPAILDAHPRDRDQILEHYDWVRGETERLAAPLSPEDQVVQSMPDASPTKWHRAHMTWFFETMILSSFAPGYEPIDPHYTFLFNSYYDAVGARHPRPQRGLLTRPSAAQVSDYRAHVDAAMRAFIAGADADAWEQAAPLIVLGLHHEQQHQELI